MVRAVRFASASLAALRPAAAASPRLRLAWAPSLGSTATTGKDNYYEENFEEALAAAKAALRLSRLRLKQAAEDP